MASKLIAENMENAEIHQGHETCRAKVYELLEEIKLPKGLLRLDDITEVGYNRTTGFVWLKQKKSKKHKFKAIGKTCWYDTLVTAFVEERRMKKVSGVKAKELLIWVTLSDIYIDDLSAGKIKCGTYTGLSKTFPVSAFEEEEEEEEEEEGSCSK